MGSPCHISGSTPRLFPQDKDAAEYSALSVIAESLAHPQRTLLSVFIQGATDREIASRFFLNEISGRDKDSILSFLGDWVTVLKKVRPAACPDIGHSLRRNIWLRDGGRCCVSRVGDGKKYDGSLVFISVLPPSLFRDDGMAGNGRLSKIVAAYIGETKLQNLRSFMGQDFLLADRDCSDQVILLSPRIFEHFRNGRLSLKRSLSVATMNSARYLVQVRNFVPYTHVETFHFIALENKAIGLASLPNATLLEAHHQFADALAWLEVSEYMKRNCDLSHNLGLGKSMSSTEDFLTNKSSRNQWHLQSVTQIFRYIWGQTPVFFRAFAYKRLARIANRLYGYSGSDRTYRLPFNLYLRVAAGNWASKHQAEFQSLRLVEKHTSIPAPRALDTIRFRDSSFLLMTGLPGEKIGRMIHTMTDEQLHAAVRDLKEYIAELRQIPNRNGSEYQICNALGGGILDWRIGDSQREELRFRDEARFNQYLTYDLPLGEDARKLILKSHSVKHDIVFTHADLNLRNILVDGSGKISGIVDWECAGWYPEYWEYTKAHFTVRHTVRWIADVVDQIFPNYRDELQVEDMLSSMAPSW
ncbi:MAG: hypothetical protein M1820_002392 [Bogoriella megaspora]|nr:MAG: hypothetical protein M1820_002392 [Bogoriella megaspora]